MNPDECLILVEPERQMKVLKVVRLGFNEISSRNLSFQCSHKKDTSTTANIRLNCCKPGAKRAIINLVSICMPSQSKQKPLSLPTCFKAQGWLIDLFTCFHYDRINYVSNGKQCSYDFLDIELTHCWNEKWRYNENTNLISILCCYFMHQHHLAAWSNVVKITVDVRITSQAPGALLLKLYTAERQLGLAMLLNLNLILCYHDRIEIDTSFSVMSMTSQTTKCHHNIGCYSVVVTFGSLVTQPWPQIRHQFLHFHNSVRMIY